MSLMQWMNLFQVRFLMDGSVWLVCRQCGARITPVRDGWSLVDLYTRTEDHEHSQ